MEDMWKPSFYETWMSVRVLTSIIQLKKLRNQSHWASDQFFFFFKEDNGWYVQIFCKAEVRQSTVPDGLPGIYWKPGRASRQEKGKLWMWKINSGYLVPLLICWGSSLTSSGNTGWSTSGGGGTHQCGLGRKSTPVQPSRSCGHSGLLNVGATETSDHNAVWACPWNRIFAIYISMTVLSRPKKALCHSTQGNSTAYVPVQRVHAVTQSWVMSSEFSSIGPGNATSAAL